MPITEEQPPHDTKVDLKEFLSRQFRAAKEEDENSDQVERRTGLPTKVSIGKLYYFTQAVAAHPVITTEGLYLYKSTGWVFVA